MRAHQNLGFGLLLPLIAACASAGMPDGAMRIGLGNARSGELSRVGTSVLRHHQFEIFRTDGPTAFYYETHWKSRTPFEDERSQGVEAAETKIILQGSERPAAGMGRVIAVELIARNRVRLRDGAEWTTIPPTPAYSAFIDTIAADLKRELQTGIRVY
ncbi:MAG TPA: hypothetical protein VF188_14640 [Longimicrobiales bacterium]